MSAEDITRMLPLVAFLVLQGIEQISAEDCGNNIHCFSPYVCCTNLKTCCYDRDTQNSMRQAYKLHVWNMWYFWFVIIFIMMSCFGGCGYYRRRRMAAIDQHRRSAITTRRHHHSRGAARNSQSYLSYVGPAASEPPELAFLPPPYTEVVNQPGMYPENKSDLPPYPGPPLIASNYAANMPPPPLSSLSAQGLAASSDNMPKPPPYTEFNEPTASQDAPQPTANHNTVNTTAANQIAANTSTANQNAENSQTANQNAANSQAANQNSLSTETANQNSSSLLANETTESSTNQCSSSNSNTHTSD